MKKPLSSAAGRSRRRRADAGSTHAKAATEGFFAGGPRLESVPLGASNPWLLDPSALQQVAQLAQVESSARVSASSRRQEHAELAKLLFARGLGGRLEFHGVHVRAAGRWRKPLGSRWPPGGKTPASDALAVERGAGAAAHLSGGAASVLGPAVRVSCRREDCERDTSTVGESSERRPGAFTWSMSGPRSGVSGRSR
jgi:hypothetical protein